MFRCLNNSYVAYVLELVSGDCLSWQPQHGCNGIMSSVLQPQPMSEKTSTIVNITMTVRVAKDYRSQNFIHTNIQNRIYFTRGRHMSSVNPKYEAAKRHCNLTFYQL